MNRFGFTVAKNATANIVRGGATAIVALALPHFLTRALDHDRFAAWALMLQIAAYANYLDFGLQTAVARYLAQAIERGDDVERDKLISTAFAMLALAGVAALVVIGVVIWQLPNIFHAIPRNLVGDLRLGLAVMAASATLMLPMSTFTGVLIGLHRNEYPALAIGGSRLFGALAVIVTAHYTHSLAWLALCIGVTNLIGAFLQFHIAKKLLPGMRVLLSQVTRMMARELAHYCSGLTVTSFAMLLVGGLDVTIVGYFDFNKVGVYAIASTLITFVTGLTIAVFNALLTPLAVLQERGEYREIHRVLMRTSELNTQANLAFLMLIFLCGNLLLRFWVGEAYANAALPILQILSVAQALRMVGNPYGTVLTATGLQKYVIPVVLVEGFTNLLLSVWFATKFGAVGVAVGTLVASIIAQTLLIFVLMPRVRALRVNSAEFFRTALLRPLLIFSPLIVWLASRVWLVHTLQSSGALLRAAPMIAGAITLGLFVSLRTIKRRESAV